MSNDHWYDMWHQHVDWYGRGNENKKARHAHLQALFALFHNFLTQLQDCKRPYQTWVFVYQNDSAQDAVYFHTPNENCDDFPMRFEETVSDNEIPELLRKFVYNKKFGIGHLTLEDDTVYIIYSNEHGVPPLVVESNECC